MEYTQKDLQIQELSKLESLEQKFEELEIEKQSILLMEVLNLFKCKPLTANMELIKDSKYLGKIQLSKNISSCKLAKLINQSPTGLYENVIDLLRV